MRTTVKALRRLVREVLSAEEKEENPTTIRQSGYSSPDDEDEHVDTDVDKLVDESAHGTKRIDLMFSDIDYGCDEYGFLPKARMMDPDDEDERYEKWLKKRGIDARVVDGVITVNEGTVTTESRDPWDKEFYHCRSCGFNFDAQKSKSDYPECPECGSHKVVADTDFESWRERTQPGDVYDDVDEDSMHLVRGFVEESIQLVSTAGPMEEVADEDEDDPWGDKNAECLVCGTFFSGNMTGEDRCPKCGAINDEIYYKEWDRGDLDEGGSWEESEEDPKWKEGNPKDVGEDVTEVAAEGPSFTGSGMDPAVHDTEHSKGPAGKRDNLPW